MRHAITVIAAGTIAGVAAPSLRAQERLVGTRSVLVTPTADVWDFGSGIAQGARDGGQTTTTITRVSQWSVPLSVSLPLTGSWRLDVEGAYASGTVTAAGGAGQGARRYRLRGPSDTRLRVTGGLVGESLLLTAGVNVPTGETQLDADELTALRVLAAPALGLSMPVLGTGRRVTAGLVGARLLRGWAYALAASYEARSAYAPATITAGLPALDFNPSDAMHASLSVDGLVGLHAMTLSLSADLFGTDRLTGDAGAAQGSGLSTRLGPIYTAEWQLRLAAPVFSELTAYAVGRYRSPFEQDGVTVAGSAGAYVDAGVRGTYPATPRTGVVFGLAARYHTGMDFDRSFVSAATTGGSALLGIARELGGGYALQPFVRGQLGRLDTGVGRGTAAGVSGGVSLGRRF